MKNIYKLLTVISFLGLGIGQGSAQVTLNATGGVLTATYTNVNSAFGAINAGTHTGTINILINGNTTEGVLSYTPTALVASGQATANYASVTIKPTLTATISGAPATGYGVLELDGADNVTIDGAISGTTKNLTVANINTNTITATAVIRLYGKVAGSLGATFNTIKNCIIIGNTEGNDGISGSAVNNSYGIYLGTGTGLLTSSGTGDNYDNNTINNNTILKSYIGIHIFGTTNTADNNVISNNIIGSNTVGQTLSFGGINLNAITSSTISQNQIFNLKMGSTTSGNNYGIQIAGTTSSSLAVTRNNITGVWQTSTGGWGAYGINITGGSYFTIVNNTISDIQTTNYSSTSTTYNAFGLRFTAGTNMRAHYNSINIIGTYTYTGFTSAASAPLVITSTAFTGTITNNIFSNTMTSNVATQVFAAIWMPGFVNYLAVTINNNGYMVPSSAVHYVARVGTGTSYYTSLASWKPISQVSNATNDNASAPVANIGGAPFTSATNLTIPANTTSQIESGAALVGVLGTNIDFNAAVRPLAGVNPNLNPDMGAYEFDGIVTPSCAGTPAAGSITGPISSCNGASVTLNLSTSTNTLLGMSYQWATSTVSAGPYSNLGTLLSQATSTTAITLYFIVTSSCSISSGTAATSVYTLNFAPNPTVTAVSSASAICAGTGATLSASGASTYTWSPNIALSSTIGANVIASPTTNITYNVIGTSTAGCNANSSVAVLVNSLPTLLSVSASPSVICSGASSSLQAIGTMTNVYIVSSISYSTIPTPTTGVTTLCNLGTAITTLSSGTLDDGGWNNLSIPFSFNFFGTAYNSFAISTNGFIVLGAGIPNTYTGYGTTFPNIGSGKPSIGINYSDLDFRTAGVIETFTTGTAPNRKLVINYTNGQFYNAVGAISTQGILYETSNVIEVHTFTSTGTNPTVEGIQDPTGTIAFTAPGRNNVTFTVVSSDAYRWSPATVNYSWTPSTFLSATNINNPVANTVTATTIYTVALTAPTGCSITASQVVSVTPVVSVTGSSVVCAGSSATITASGVTSYSWSTGATSSSIVATPTTNTSYVITGTNSIGCVSSATQAVTVNALPSVSLSAAQTTACTNGSTITLTGSPAGGTYTGTNVSGTIFTPGVSAGTFMPTYAYTSTVTGCSKTATTTIIVSVCTGIDSKIAGLSGIELYPNPNTGIFIIELNNGLNKTIQVTDLTGRIVLEDNTTSDKFNVNINTLVNGIYYVKVISNNAVEVFKVIKQ